ncbi:MAG: DUF2318 domain-containing protein [Deltaproteobacteria bacterium]|nr:DUF2318 domain-containing protein [Deltaproteobacteria bacterium]
MYEENYNDCDRSSFDFSNRYAQCLFFMGFEIQETNSHKWSVKYVLKSSDGVIRAAIDACDVCYRSGKGYVQEGDFMVCTNCGRRFASTRINEIKGGCNPAPLNRKIIGKNLVIEMKDINANSWYCQYKKQ